MMKEHTEEPATTLRHVRYVVIVGLFVLLIPIALGGLFILPDVLDVTRSNRQKENLIHRSDHQAILAACRELMEKYPDQTMDGNDSRLPKAIQEIHPFWVSVSKESITVELHGGFDHYGVVAFPKGTEGGGAKKLIDGLWYYSE
jgi:hypothetical protein